MNIGIVGHEGAKFTPITEATARAVIREILTTFGPDVTLVSGGCHLGGIDIWAEEEARALGFPEENIIVHKPEIHSWKDEPMAYGLNDDGSPLMAIGYRTRNLMIADDSEIVYNILIKEYPPEFKGRRFDYCYHCDTSDHIKSGGCWTARRAIEKGKTAIWIIIPPLEIEMVNGNEE